jgi:acyl-CoA synthetase (AMP-forming)/AMP-acid ligase II
MTMRSDAPTPPPTGTLGEILAARAHTTPDRVAFTYSSADVSKVDTLTYRSLHRRAQDAAGRLLQAARPRARVLLLFEPGLDFVGALFGCFQSGTVGVSAMPPTASRLHRAIPRLRAIAIDAGIDAVLTTAAIRDVTEPLLTKQDTLMGVPWIAVDDDSNTVAPGVAAANPSDLAFIQYTSGSTFVPRGVMLTHANLLANAEVIRKGLGLSSETRGFSWLPPSHDMGLISGILEPVYLGYPSALISPLTVIKRPLRWLEGISAFRATMSGGPNFAYELAVRRTTPAQRASLDLSCWEVAFNGAEPVRAQTLLAFAEAFAPSGFRRSSLYPCYGLAEATLMVTGPSRRRDPTMLDLDARGLETGIVQAPAAGSRPMTLVGCGEPAEGHQLAIVDPDSRRACSPDRIGEIWVSGPSVAPGYWGEQPRTAEAFGARIAGADQSPEFLRTGDLGFLRAGELFIVGRHNELIILNGRNHHPHDIELSAESSHRQVRPHCSAAFAIERDGGQAGAAIVLEINQTPAGEIPAIIQAVRRQVAHDLDLQLERIALVAPGTIPKTTSGKIQRRLCHRQLANAQLISIADWRPHGGTSGDPIAPARVASAL